jgi:hypothetical protein
MTNIDSYMMKLRADASVFALCFLFIISSQHCYKTCQEQGQPNLRGYSIT